MVSGRPGRRVHPYHSGRHEVNGGHLVEIPGDRTCWLNSRVCCTVLNVHGFQLPADKLHALAARIDYTDVHKVRHSHPIISHACTNPDDLSVLPARLSTLPPSVRRRPDPRPDRLLSQRLRVEHRLHYPTPWRGTGHRRRPGYLQRFFRSLQPALPLLPEPPDIASRPAHPRARLDAR